MNKTSIKVSLFILVWFLGSISTAQAQSFDEYKKRVQSEFNQYKSDKEREFKEYRDRINAEFAEFLKKPWEKKDAEKPAPEPPKVPDVPPVVLPDIDIDLPEDNLIDIDIDLPLVDETPIPIAPIPYKPKPREKTMDFTFYGTPGSFRFDPDNKARLKSSSEKDVSRFWEELSGEAYDNLLADCLNMKKALDLCDWAYFKMTEKVAETMYGKSNDATVFQTWLLAQSGYRARLGRENKKLYLLLNTNELLFGKPYYTLDDGRYFLLDDSLFGTQLHVLGASFPDTKALRMTVAGQNKLVQKDTKVRGLRSKKYPDASAQVVCNSNLLDFMNDCPSSALEGSQITDWRKYAYTPLSASAQNRLYPALRRQINGKNEAEAANILLNFVQTAFEYKTDQEAWGYERSFFPEETLYYPYSDCEDRAILFCRLVTDLLGLPAALVYYPGHLAAAVQFKSAIPGDYFLIDGKRFLICDPTYINAPIGLTMPGMDNKTAKVFPL